MTDGERISSMDMPYLLGPVFVVKIVSCIICLYFDVLPLGVDCWLQVLAYLRPNRS